MSHQSPYPTDLLVWLEEQSDIYVVMHPAASPAVQEHLCCAAFPPLKCLETQLELQYCPALCRNDHILGGVSGKPYNKHGSSLIMCSMIYKSETGPDAEAYIIITYGFGCTHTS